jgi:Domain of unknown function (DUF4386)
VGLFSYTRWFCGYNAPVRAGASVGGILNVSPRLTARVAGVLYLLIFIAAPSATATPARMIITHACDTGVALIFYFLFKPVSKSLSLLAAIFRLILVVIMVTGTLNYFGGLNLFNAGHSAAAFDKLYALALVPFGVHCLLIGYLVFRSGFLPRFLGVLMAIAGLGWLTFVSPSLAHHLYAYIPGIVGEGALTLWLLVVGLNEKRWNDRASAAI